MGEEQEPKEEGVKNQLTIGAIRPPNTIIPHITDKLVKYCCFNVFGVYKGRRAEITMVKYQ